MARDLDPVAVAPLEAADEEVAAALDVLRDQLVLVLVRRLGGRVLVTSAEMRSACGALAFRLDPATRAFTFTLERGQ